MTLVKHAKKLDFQSITKVFRSCFDIQNNGAESKDWASRFAGALLNKVEDAGGIKARKVLTSKVEETALTIRKWQKDAEIPESDFKNYNATLRRQNKEITDSAIRRIGKTSKTPIHLSTAAYVIKCLSPWLNSLHLRSLSRKEYVGTIEEIQEAAKLLKDIGEQFIQTANKLNATS